MRGPWKLRGTILALRGIAADQDASALTWLARATARLLACREEEDLIGTADQEIRRGLGVDRVKLALVDRWSGKWLWALRDDQGGVPCALLPSYVYEALDPPIAKLLVEGP